VTELISIETLNEPDEVAGEVGGDNGVFYAIGSLVEGKTPT
jgi:hypothetical protein